jgi:predicted Fe-Mo cluster-binding NifX family protein
MRGSHYTLYFQDCEVLIARGMGQGAYEAIKQSGIKPIITDLIDADEAVEAYIKGTLEDHPERLH